MNNYYTYALIIGCLLILGLLIANYRANSKLHSLRQELYEQTSRLVDALDAIDAKVDPWAMQAQLMGISAQHRPISPKIHDGSLLYVALVMEEAAETFDAMVKALFRHQKEGGWEPVYAMQLQRMMISLHQARNSCALESRAMRSVLAEKPGVMVALTEDEAVELLDGTTDIAVVNSGLALSSGLNGAEGYREVAGSNLSKANPDTNIIEKDAGGKWIKGRDYREPDLARVISAGPY